jgi:antitoxin PrlF
MAAKKTRATESACCGSDCCDQGCACCGVAPVGCCQVEAIVSLDARGQLVLPKDVREKAGFAPDQKLALVSWKRGEEICCVTLQSADEIGEAVRRTYGPLLSTLTSRP